MKAFINKYPIVGNCTYPNSKGELPDGFLDMAIAKGKLWEIVGVSQIDVIVSHDGFHVMVNSGIFKLAFTEVDLPV